MIYPLLVNRYPTAKLINRILYRGRDEQELQFLFPTLYGNKAVSRNTAGQYKNFNRQLRRGKYAVHF